MNYYERHIGDYLKDTAHLGLLEHGNAGVPAQFFVNYPHCPSL